MIELRPFNELGRFRNDWLDAHYHFSFSAYHRPNRDGWGSLLVWNDDAIRSKTGFPRHGHRDMEIVTYVREGAITHQDHLGNVGRTEAGDVQVMSAGTGIEHAEYNLEGDDTRIFQLWVLPNRMSVKPAWAQRAFPKTDRAGRLVPLASGRVGHEGALPIHADAAILGATLLTGQSVDHSLDSGRFAYLVPAKGRIRVNGIEASARDGVAIRDLAHVKIEALEDSEILIADVPPAP